MKRDRTLDRRVRTTLARAVTDGTVSDEMVSAVTDSLVTLSKPGAIRTFDICTYGICVDYVVDAPRWPDLIDEMLRLNVSIRKFEGFPWGILDDDLLRLRVEVEVDELAGIGH